jgi:hypothetical protein
MEWIQGRRGIHRRSFQQIIQAFGQANKQGGRREEEISIKIL